jgi:hypothetical protein
LSTRTRSRLSGPEAKARSGRGRDQRTSAYGRHEFAGSQLFAASRQMRKVHEDQILKGFADGEEIDARHARKV